MLYARQLKCIINNKVLFREVSFVLFYSDILHVVGSNGCGKTTLLKLLSLLYKNSYGDIFWNGKLVKNYLYNYLCDILFLGHESGLHFLLTPIENLYFYESLVDNKTNICIEDILFYMGLYKNMSNNCSILSAGQIQRVLLSRLFLQKSKIWILDEPYSYLDFNGINVFNNIVSSFLNSGGILILSDHTNFIRKFSNCKILNLENFD